MEEINEQQFLDLNGGGTYVAIPKPAKGHLYRTHPHSQFRLFFNNHELREFLNSAKSFAECRFSDDYIILQMMEHETSQGTLVEFLKFGNLDGAFADPTAFDLAPWISVEKELPMHGSRVLVFVGEKSETGDYLYTNISMKIYDAQKGFQFNNEDVEVLFWKPLSPPDGFIFL